MSDEIQFRDKYPTLAKHCIKLINSGYDLTSIPYFLSTDLTNESSSARSEYLDISSQEEYKFFRFLADESVRYWSTQSLSDVGSYKNI